MLGGDFFSHRGHREHRGEEIEFWGPLSFYFAFFTFHFTLLIPAASEE